VIPIRLIAVVVAMLGCTDPAEPQPMPSSAERLVAAVDTLNIAIRAFHASGGRIDLLQLLYPDAIPPDPTIPPVVVILLRHP
jgi:hypothetical protein